MITWTPSAMAIAPLVLIWFQLRSTVSRVSLFVRTSRSQPAALSSNLLLARYKCLMEEFFYTRYAEWHHQINNTEITGIPLLVYFLNAFLNMLFMGGGGVFKMKWFWNSKLISKMSYLLWKDLKFNQMVNYYVFFFQLSFSIKFFFFACFIHKNKHFFVGLSK